MKVAWDYSSLASAYDKRADYSAAAVDFIFNTSGCSAGSVVADLGAGTAKLSRPLADRGAVVHAVEPNDQMREFGIKNTVGKTVTWSVGTGEETGLPDHTFSLVTFGSSFNVTDRPKALKETSRILVPRGWFACLWNHRNLEDPLQAEVESLIKDQIAEYSYGSRREDQGAVIADSGLFEPTVFKEFAFTVAVPVVEYVEGWRSHGTLQRQAKDKFDEIIRKIDNHLSGRSTIDVPYHTRLWMTRLKS